MSPCDRPYEQTANQSHRKSFVRRAEKQLASFQRYESRALSNEPAIRLKGDAPSADDCAQQCLQTSEMNCSSFDFCRVRSEVGPELVTCHLHDVHLAADPSKALQWDAERTECDHYASE